MSNREQVLSYIVAGNNEPSFKILAKDRCKSAINILGNYRIFDFVASNIINTRIHLSLVAAQSQLESLGEYINYRKKFYQSESISKFEIIELDKYDNETKGFRGIADSIRKNISRIDRYNPDIVLILNADHVYFMNYNEAIIQHKIKNSDATIITSTIPHSKAGNFEIVKVDKYGNVTDYVEKPKDPEVINEFKLTSEMKKCLNIDNSNQYLLASTGNYIFFWDRLKSLLNCSDGDFDQNIISIIKNNGGTLNSSIIKGYWHNVGKIQDYFDCNMDFAQGPNSLIFLLRHWLGMPSNQLSYTQIFDNSSIQYTILSYENMIGKWNNITNSVFGNRISIGEGCKIDYCILLGADTNNSHSNKIKYTTNIGKGSRLSHVILDNNICFGEGVDVGPHNGTPEERANILQNIGLKPYKELSDGRIEGDFYIDPETEILIIGKQKKFDPENPILPNGIKC